MRWRFVLAWLLGTLCGFAGFFCYDMCGGWTGFEHVCGNPTPPWVYVVFSGQFDHDVRQGYLAKHFERARTLMYEYWLLTWLTERGAYAYNTAVIFGLLLPAFAVAAENVQRRHKLQLNGTPQVRRLNGTELKI